MIRLLQKLREGGENLKERGEGSASEPYTVLRSGRKKYENC
jgi:hypothetical protein